jgi:hypothetical protein
MTKNMIFASMGVAGLVAVAAIADMATGNPFGRYSMVMDILYLLGAAIVLYMGYDTYRDIK